MSEKLTIKISGKDEDIDVTSFLTIVRLSHALLSHLSGRRAAWKVGVVSHSSPITFEMVSDQHEATAACQRFWNGLNAIETGRNASDYFDRRALKIANTLASQLRDGVSDVSFYWRNERKSAPRQVDADQEPTVEPYEAITEVDGLFEAIDVHGRSEFRLYDRVTGHATVCVFKDIPLQEIGKHLKKRLRVLGKATFDSQHRPVKLKVLDWNPVEDSLELEDLHRAGFKLQGELSAREIIANLREMDD